MIGALGSCPCEGDLGDFFGRCGGLTMFGRCGGPTMFGRRGGLTMRSTHGSTVSSLYAPTRSAVGFGLERLPSRTIVSGWKRRRLHPKGPQAAPGSDFGGPVGSPASIHGCFVGVPAQRMELGAKGREGPPLGNIRLAWDTTVTCDADHVTCCEINVYSSGKLWNASKTPRHVGISPGPDCPLPVCSDFVIISLCDVHHNHPRAKGGNTVQGLARIEHD
jgi:hypothetical protein